MRRISFVASLVVCVASLFLLASVAQAQSVCAPPTNANVTTWHYDNCRTGWQQNETVLNTTTVNKNGTFGKIMQYNVQGATYAQPLALYQVTNMTGCSGSCNVVFVATEQDMLYAYNADYTTTQTPGPLWSLNLAPTGGTYLDCSGSNPPPPCGINPYMGVTGTPVIDTSAGILYVVSIVYFSTSGAVEYWIHAVNYQTGLEMSNSPYQITASAPGYPPTMKCHTATSSGNITFEPNYHNQRAGLLLLNGEVYVAFNPTDSEEENGWLMAFSYNSPGYPNAFHLDDTFVTTPYGTGGGLWMSAAGIAAESGSNGTYIYISVANGTFDFSGPPPNSTDFGDSVLKLSPSLVEQDYFTPYNVLTFNGGNKFGLCLNDEDLGSGGVMLFPDSVVTGYPYLMIAADKQSNFYVINRDNLTGFNPSGDTIVQELLTPQGTNSNGQPNGQPEEPAQGYWGSPAYWEWTVSNTTKRAIYYSVDATDGYGAQGNSPLPMNMYILDPETLPGPLIPTVPDSSTTTAFCLHGGAPSVSSSTSAAYTGVAGTGIVWAYEDSISNCQGPSGPAVLHAYDASNISTELYNSGTLTSVGSDTRFSTPVVFNGKVYIGTQSEVDVFGHCGGQPACFTQ